MKNRINFLFLLVVFLTFSHCGQSPFLHHKNADELQNASSQKETKRTEESSFSGIESCDFHFEKSKKCGSITWETQPNLKKKTDGSFFLHTWEGDSENKNGIFNSFPYSYRLYLFMGSMGHGTGKDIVLNELKEGEYRASSVYPIMRGDWQIYFELLNPKNPDEIVDTALYCCDYNGLEMKCPSPCPSL